MDKTELAKLQNYLRRLFNNNTIKVVARPKKTDSAEGGAAPNRASSVLSRCDAENTVARTCVIVNGFLSGTSLAWQLVRDGSV